jgi:hypothetical protein
MNTQIARRALFGGLMGVALLGCGGGETGTTAPVDKYLPVISNFWRNTKASTHTLTLLSTDDLKPTGAFTGTEAHPTFGSSAATGTWTNSTFTMTIARNGGAVTYSGKFISRDTLRLIRQADTLVFWHA